MSEEVLTGEMIERVAERFRALGEATRLRLLMEIKRQPRSVSELINVTGLSRSAVSRHLGVLRQVGLVSVEREGSLAIYEIKDCQVFDLCSIMCEGVRRHHTETSAALGMIPEGEIS
jgi:DNA-binding transcriptional ArsR family regulator